jgi:predicted O-methyltransferase YrrM
MKLKDKLTQLDPRAQSWHPSFIKKLAIGMDNPKYLEVGIYRGETFNRVAKHCSLAVGIDIDPLALSSIRKKKNIKLRLGDMDSIRAEFAETFFDLIFIDADHRKGAVVSDFSVAKDLLSQNGLILMHDTWPGSIEFADEARCGTAYLALPDLRKSLPDWQFITLPFHPGLTFAQRIAAKPAWTS